MSTEKASRSRGRWALGAIAALLIVAVVAGIFLYNFLTAYFAVNGTWYGPMKLQVGPTTVTLQAYVDLSTHLNGDLVGTGDDLLQDANHQRHLDGGHWRNREA